MRKTKAAVFLDRDGVLNGMVYHHEGWRSPTCVEDFRFLPGVPDAVARLRAAGFLIVVVTNQPDVSRGWLQRAQADAMNARVCDALGIDALRACFHADGADCACRKPRPGLLLDAARELGIDLAASWMVGDRHTDIAAAQAAGCAGAVLVEGPAGPGEPRADASPSARVRDLAAAVEWILAQ
jgi:D-glycero-D-manno-heptose 1,7-bisphosphate phosphatase